MDVDNNSSEAQKSDPPAPPLPHHHFLLITAAAYSTMGEVRISSIKKVGQAGSLWATSGRTLHHQSSPKR
jgi:hypothetical protein